MVRPLFRRRCPDLHIPPCTLGEEAHLSSAVSDMQRTLITGLLQAVQDRPPRHLSQSAVDTLVDRLTELRDRAGIGHLGVGRELLALLGEYGDLGS